MRDIEDEPNEISRVLTDQESRALLKLAPGRRMSKFRIILIILLVILYLSIVLTYIICMRYQVLTQHPWVLYVTKPLPLTLLLVLVPLYAEYNRKTLMYAIWIYLGLICCLVGDVILMFQSSIPYAKNIANAYDFSVSNTNTHTNSITKLGSSSDANPDSQSRDRDAKIFIYGMLCYMIGKCFYTIAFTIGVGKIFRFKILHSIPFYAFGAMVVALVYTEIGDDFAYLVVYVFVECTMGWRALALTSGFPGSDRAKLLLWLSVVGSAMLMAADTLSIYNAYYEPLRGASFFACGIYWLGQLLIIFSIPRRLTNSDYWLYHFTYINPFVN